MRTFDFDFGNMVQLQPSDAGFPGWVFEPRVKQTMGILVRSHDGGVHAGDVKLPQRAAEFADFETLNATAEVTLAFQRPHWSLIMQLDFDRVESVAKSSERLSRGGPAKLPKVVIVDGVKQITHDLHQDLHVLLAVPPPDLIGVCKLGHLSFLDAAPFAERIERLFEPVDGVQHHQVTAATGMDTHDDGRVVKA